MAHPRTPGAAAGEPLDPGDSRRDAREGSDRTRAAMDDVQRSASSLLEETRRDGKRMLDRQKDSATEQVGAVASALRSAADDLHQHDDRAGRFVEYAADRLESFGNMVRHKDIDSLIQDAERLGRRSPVAFFAGSVALGFLLSRFLKSSVRRSEASERSGTPDEERGPTTWPPQPAPPVAATTAYPDGAADRSVGSVTEVTR